VYSGQVPGRDFVVTFPASLYLLTALSFRLFGVTWHALSLGACCVYAALLLLGLRLGALVRKNSGEQPALWTVLAYAAGQTIPLLSINYLWHASLSQSFGLYAVYAAFAIVNSRSQANRWRHREAFIHLAFACACLLLSKPNTAFPVILLCLFALRCAQVSRLQIAALLASALVLITLALARVHVTPWGMLGAYAGLTGRLLPRAFANGILYALYARYGLANLLVYSILAPAIFAAAVWFWRERPRILTDPNLLLAFGSITIAILGMGTNFDFKLTDAPLALFGLGILSVQQIAALRTLPFRTAITAVALLLVALYFGRTRLRMQNVGSWAEEQCPGRLPFVDRFLGHLTACPIVPATLTEVDQTLAASPTARVFFGPSLEFLYAARHLPSPPHLPNWWDPGSSYPLRKSDQVSKAWEDNHFNLLIFNREEDRAQLPARLQQDLATGYVLVPGTTFIHVYRPR
ncbi:MAG: hypothetical protein ACRYFU_01955, partial [Janthinobacterium lividum]